MRNDLSDVMALFATRRSVRDYSEKPLTEEEISALISIGYSGPISGGIKCIFIRVLRNEAEKHLFRKACFYQDFVECCSCVFLIGCDESKLKQQYDNEYTQVFSCENASIAAENIIIGAHIMDLASCYVGALRRDIIKQLLDSDQDDVRIWCGVCIGNKRTSS